VVSANNFDFVVDLSDWCFGSESKAQPIPRAATIESVDEPNVRQVGGVAAQRGFGTIQQGLQLQG